MPRRIFLVYIVPVFLLAGCAEFYGRQAPAPVYGGRRVEPSSQAAYPAHKDRKHRKKRESSTVMTEPLPEPSAPESIEFNSEALSADSAGEAQTGIQALPLTEPFAAEVHPVEPKHELTPFEPLDISASLSPAVDALVVAANQNASSGNLEAASATIERAIRIEPRNANLYYKLALVRLQQSKPRLAEDLAKKSALLAASDSTLKKHSWLLIAHARELQNNFKGAKEARAKANRF
jgi:tetratricopeptide (TPR) repeat protein